MSTRRPVISIVSVADDDIPKCMQIMSKSFGHDAPFVDAWFVDHDTVVGQAKGIPRLAAWKKNDHNATFLKAMMTDSSGKKQIMGWAVWTYMTEPPPQELDLTEDVTAVWPNEDDREFMARLWRDYVVPRSRTIEATNGKGVYGQWEQSGMARV